MALNNLQRLICHKTHQTKPNQIWFLNIPFVSIFTWLLCQISEKLNACSPQGYAYLARLSLLLGTWGALKGECRQDLVFSDQQRTRLDFCLASHHRMTLHHIGGEKSVKYPYHLSVCSVGLSCRIHRLRLYNECPRYDIKQSDGEVPGMLEHPFIAIAPRSTLARSGSTYLWVK